MTTFQIYISAKVVLNTLFMILSICAVYTSWKSPNLRRSPIFCSVAFALITSCIEKAVVFYGHDYPSALLRDDIFDDVHGLISFVAMTQWFAHLLNLLMMTVYYCILLYDVNKYEKLAKYRFRALLAILIAGAAFASPYLNSEYYGFDFTVESLSWSLNPTKSASIVYTTISWFFLCILTVVVFTAGIVMGLFIRRANNKTPVPMASIGSDSKIKLIAAFFAITIAYYVPVLSFTLTPMWYSERWHELYESLDVLDDIVEGSKWLAYAMSSVEFRKALIRMPWFRCCRTRVRVVKIT